MKHHDFVLEMGRDSVTMRDSVSEVPDEFREKLKK